MPAKAAYRVEVDWSPVYELTTSLRAFLDRPEHKVLDLGPAWVERTRRKLSPALAAELKGGKDLKYATPPDTLIWQSPAKDSVDGFLAWLEGLSAGDVYELLAPYLPEDASITVELAAARARMYHLLGAWNEDYFRSVDPALLEALRAEAGARRAALPAADPPAFVEEATNGVYLEPVPGLEMVILVPQYHFSPFTTVDDYRALSILGYAAVLPGRVTPDLAARGERREMGPARDDRPPARLLRLVRTLGDESRLRLLRHLAAGPRTFTELLGYAGLAKSTVYHHLVALRAAGLVRTIRSPGTTYNDRYELRPGALDALSAGLKEYLKG